MRLNQMSTLEKQYLVQVSRTVLDPKTDAATLNLDQVAKGAADSLRLDAPKARKLQQSLLADWSNPTEAARRFEGELKTQLACEQYGVFEPDLLARIAGLTSHVKAAPAGRPEGGELPACFTAEGWNDTFVRLTNDFEGLEPGVTDAREYLNPGGKAMVERLVDLAGITPGRQPPLRVLNLCSGEGGEARHLAKLGCEVDAVDISDVACAVAERLNEGNTGPGKVNVICSDIAKIPLQENKYDIIFFPDGDGVHYQQDRQALFDRLQHVTKDGGKLVGSFYVPGQGASQAQRDAFDEGMTWSGFTPRGVNADSYSAGLQQAGFVPTQRDGEAARDSIARREVGGTDIARVYNDWHEGVLKNQAAEGREDQWLQNNWMAASKQAPNGFGFVLDATVKKSG